MIFYKFWRREYMKKIYLIICFLGFVLVGCESKTGTGAAIGAGVGAGVGYAVSGGTGAIVSDDVVIAGVASGIALYLGIDPLIVRVLFIFRGKFIPTG